MSKKFIDGKDKYSLIFPIVLVCFSPLGIDLVLPAVKDIAQSLGTRDENSGLIVSVFVLSLGIGQVPFGKLSDHWGRRATSILGLLIFAIGAACSFAASEFSTVIVARFIQGLGASATTVCAFATIRDHSKQSEAADGFAKLTAVLNLATTTAPLLSLVPLLLFGWRSVFALYVIVSLFIMAYLYGYMPETALKQGNEHSGSKTGRVFAESSAWLPATVTIFVLSFLLSHVAIAPVILMQRLGLSSIEFGAFFTVNAVVIVIASVYVGRLTMKFGDHVMVTAGLSLVAIASGALALLGASNLLISPWLYITPVAIGSVGFSFSFGNAQALALAKFDNSVGIASGLLGSIQMCTASAISAFLVSFGATGLMFGSVFLILCAPLAMIWFKKFVRKSDSARQM